MTSTINDQLAEIIFSFSRVMKEEMTFDSETSQLTVLQLQALILIKKKKILSMSDIADQFKISLPTATVLSDKLVKTKLVKRARSKSDRRIVNVLLTEKGEVVLTKAIRQRHQKINKMLSYLSLKDKRQILRIMKNLSGKIEKAYEK